MFDLNKALAAWRRGFQYQRVVFREDLDELECHLRDHIDELLASGYTEEKAFRAAMQDVGDARHTQAEYRKVFWPKLKHRRSLLREFIWQGTMFTNYVKIALRNLRKYKGYAAINITGLAIGLACCFVIVLFVQHELGFDRFHEQGDRIYRLIRNTNNNGQAMRSATTESAYAIHLKEAFPEIAETVRIWMGDTVVLEHDAQRITAEGFAFADASVFDVFTFPLAQGNPETALQDPASVVLTEHAAQALFGSKDPMGQTFIYNNEIELTVTGILQALPDNSHLHFAYLASTEIMRTIWRDNILDNYDTWIFYTYALLQPGVDPAPLAAKLPAFLDRQQGPETSTTLTLELQPLADIHFETDTRRDVATNTERRYLYIFSAIAVFILLIACVNFMNLATARATQRAREIGLRKVLGAFRWQLIGQFMGESVVLSIAAIGLAIGLAGLALPVFGQLIGRTVSISSLADLPILGLLVGLGLLTGLAAGSYPALYLSSFEPIRALKGHAGGHKSGVLLRKSLIVIQFSIALFLLVGTLTVYNQLAFMQRKNLGFATDQVLYLNMNEALNEHFDAFKQALVANPNVRGVSRGGGNMPGYTGFIRTYQVPGETGTVEWQVQTMLVDPDFLPLLDLELVEGRNFSWDVPTDVNSAYVLNEAAARQLGWEAPLEGAFQTWDREPGQVIGIVKDFHFKSLHQKIRPLVLHMLPPGWTAWQLAVRLRPENLPETLHFLETQWQAFSPAWPFRYRFLDDAFGQLYASDQRLMQLFSYFAGLAFFVTCLGLYGLVAFTTEQRTREIGVRKVLGASVPGIVLLLTRDFARLVLLACILACPVAYLVMDRWLQDFAYRIEISWPIFLIAGLAALGIALLTVSYQSIKAALADPVESLRYE